MVDLLLTAAALFGLVLGSHAHDRREVRVEQLKCHCVCASLDTDPKDLPTLKPGEAWHLKHWSRSVMCAAPDDPNPKVRLQEISDQRWANVQARWFQEDLDQFCLTMEHAALFDPSGNQVETIQIGVKRRCGLNPPKSVKWKKHTYDFSETLSSGDRPNGFLHYYIERRK